MSPIADSSPSWRDPDHPTAHDRFRQIFRDHWDTWCDLRLEDEVPPDQRAYVRKTIERLILCRGPSAGYARYVCPGCGCIMQPAEMWEPQRGRLWMRRWLDTHRMHTAAFQALERIRARHHRYH
jgi:hypothetical protein